MAEEGEKQVPFDPADAWVQQADATPLTFLSTDYARDLGLEPWMVRFIELYAKSGIQWEAAKAARVSVHTVIKAKAKHDGFREAFEAASKSPYNRVKRRALEIAEHGTEKGIYFQGKLCATETEWDTGLMWNFLKTGLREEFGDKLAIDLAAVTAEIDLSPQSFAEREERIARLLARAGVVLPKVAE